MARFNQNKSKEENIDILISGGIVLTMNPKGEIISDGAVGIKGDKIVFVGSKKEADNYFKTGRRGGATSPARIILDFESLKDSESFKTPTPEIINAKGSIIMPGLVNAHTHAAMSLFRGYADDLPLKNWLENYIFPAEKKFVDKNFVYWGTKLSCLEMIYSGMTCFSDMYFFEDEAGKAAEQIGMRAVIGEGMLVFPTPNAKTPEEGLVYVEDLIKKWKGNPLKTCAITPHGIYTCSEEILKRAKDLSDKYKLPLIIHLSETKGEVEEIKKKYKKPPVEYLKDLGILGENFVGVHSVWLDENEIEILKEYKAKVIHCPESNMKLASGVAPITKMLAKDIIIGLGTDGAASNNNLDMFGEMDFAAKLAKVSEKNPEVLKAQEVVRMATIDGARTLGLEKSIGSLEAGKKADIIIINLNRPHLIPLYPAPGVYSHLVYSVSGADVESVIINGKMVMRDRKLLTIDKEEVFRETRRIADRIHQE